MYNRCWPKWQSGNSGSLRPNSLGRDRVKRGGCPPRMRRAGSCFLGILLVLLASQIASAQVSSGTLFGTVTDPSGSHVPGAQVKVINQQTQAERTVGSDANGNYTAAPIPNGVYTIRVSAAGFADAQAANVQLEVDQRREVDLVLQVAGITSSVEVSAETPLVESTTSALGQVVHETQVVELPLNGRDFVQLGTLTPGAVQSQGTQFNAPTASTSARGTTSLSVNGMRENANDWTLDGVDNNELTAGSISIMPSIDAIQEFKVMTSNYSAQYGRNGGGTILITTKSGTNVIHGTAFEFVRNDIFNARNFFDKAKPTYRQNQFGGSMGGPVVKNKLFFFGDYQGMRLRKRSE